MSPGRREDGFSMQLLNESIKKLSTEIEHLSLSITGIDKTMALHEVRLLAIEKNTRPCDVMIEHKEWHKKKAAEEERRDERAEERKWGVGVRLIASFLTWVFAAGFGALLAKCGVK